MMMDIRTLIKGLWDFQDLCLAASTGILCFAGESEIRKIL